ncbi:hypothetical protein ACP4OV_008828 [Aristida adscensionis]
MASVRQQQLVVGVVAAVVIMAATAVKGFVSGETWRAVRRANRENPFLGLVVPNSYEMDPVLSSPSFKPSSTIANLDIQGGEGFGSDPSGTETLSWS